MLFRSRVVIIGRKADAVAKAAAEIGGDTLGVTADVSRVADLDRAFAEIRDRVGRVDILFANARFNAPGRMAIAWNSVPPNTSRLAIPGATRTLKPRS